MGIHQKYACLLYYPYQNLHFTWGFHGVIIWQLDLQLPMQSVPITSNVVSLNPTQSKQDYVKKIVNDL